MNSLFNGIYNGKKVLVTGHTGFKGSWLCIWLKQLGAQAIGYSFEPNTEPSMFKICNLEKNVGHLIGDIRNINKLSEAINEFNPDIIFHLAAQPLVRLSYKEPLSTYEINVMGTANILEAARHSKSVKGVVVITTDKCYENKEWVYGYRETDPMGGYDPYSSSKGCAELVVSSFRNSYYKNDYKGLASARAGNVIGGGDWAEDRLIPDFVRATSQNQNIIIRNPSATRPWQHVLEPLSGYLLLGSKLLEGKSEYSTGWNFGPKDSDVLSVEDILELSITAWKKGKYVVDGTNQPHEANLLKLDISKAKAYLKWEPVYDVTQAVSVTIDWYKAYYENKIDMYEYSVDQISMYVKSARQKRIEWSVI